MEFAREGKPECLDAWTAIEDQVRPLRSTWIMFLLWALGTYVPAFLVLLWILPPQHIGRSSTWNVAFLLPSLTVVAIGTLVMREGCAGGSRGAMAGLATGFAVSIVSTSVACAGMASHGEAAAWSAIALAPIVISASAVGAILGAFCHFDSIQGGR